MALFSRRTKKTDADTAAADQHIESDPALEETSPAAPEGSAPTPEPAPEPVPEVKISVSTFRGAGAASVEQAAAPAAPADPVRAPSPRTYGPSTSAPTAEAAASGAVPGLLDNVVLRETLAQLSEKPDGPELLGVVRQLLGNHVFLRIQGDARALLSEGKPLPLSVGKVGDASYVLAYSSGAAIQAALRADGQADTSAMGQPVPVVLGHVLAGEYAGLILDSSSGQARAVLPRAVLERAVAQADPEMRLKSLLASARTDDTTRAVAEVLPDVPLWVAVNAPTPAEGEQPRYGIAEGRTAEGGRLVEVYSHPLEVVSMGRGDKAMPFSAAQLGKALRDHDEIVGVIIDAAGPFIRIDRDDLGPVIALPEPAAAT